MRDADYIGLANGLIGAVLHAGRVQMQFYRTGLSVDRKADRSPVTDADRLSEEILLAAIAAAMPDVPIVAEESVCGGRVPSIGDRFFLVDPLDGTREFVDGRDEFTINVALIESGCPSFGLVYAPALSQLCVTLGDARAVESTVAPDAQATTIGELSLRPMRTRIADAQALVALASRSHMTAETRAWLADYKISGTRQAGSSLKFCVVARGEADVYPRLGPTCEWDTAAGQAVLQAAGGRVTTLDGAPLAYGKAVSGFLNPNFVAWGRGDVRPAS